MGRRPHPSPIIADWPTGSLQARDHPLAPPSTCHFRLGLIPDAVPQTAFFGGFWKFSIGKKKTRGKERWHLGILKMSWHGCFWDLGRSGVSPWNPLPRGGVRGWLCAHAFWSSPLPAPEASLMLLSEQVFPPFSQGQGAPSWSRAGPCP